jgi:iron complex outermembrane receptor protein
MLLSILISFLSFSADSTLKTTELNEVEVRVFEQKKSSFSSPDAITILDSQSLTRTNTTSFVSALNAQAGVRMEERSPGSYRMAIRGSALRAPFGVRNVKVYWNQMPLTDAGNNTYLSLIDPDLFNQLTIIKGPSGGLYGAGTGGVMLFNSPNATQKKIIHQEIANSLGGYKQSWDVQTNNHRVFASYWDQNGYRKQSDINKQWISYEYHKEISRNTQLDITSYYGRVTYQTPGGLTLKQYQTDPQQARPAAGAFLSAVDQQATFRLRTFGLGVQVTNQWNENWSFTSNQSTQLNSIENPTIRNYEIRKESTYSSRNVVHYKKEALSMDAGLEFQAGTFDSQTFGNRKGIKDTLQFTQNTRLQTGSLFMQAEYKLHDRWQLTLAGSYNQFWTEYVGNEGIFSPRIAIMHQVNPHQNVVFKVVHGYSPPSISEMRPSTGIINTSLRAEKGWNKEVSWRGNYAFLNWNISLYQFDLNETIVIRRAADGSDYFSNVGKTRQQGIEFSHVWKLSPALELTHAETIQNFRFVNYQNATKDFSGNRLTGTSPFQHASTASYAFSPWVRWHVQFIYTDKLYLNDANTDQLPAYHLWNSKIEFQRGIWQAWVSAENLGDITYSAGPDLNAVGGRYFNAAAGRNFSLGLKISIN